MKLKRVTGLILGFIMIFNICGYARTHSTFDYLVSQNSEIITRLNSAGLTNARINSFFTRMDEEADKFNPDNLDALEEFFLFTLFITVFDDEEFADVFGAFDIAFQEEIQLIYENMGNGIWYIPPSFNEFFMSVMYDKIKVNKPTIPIIPTPDTNDEEAPEEPIIPVPEEIFNDVSSGHWAYEYILSLYNLEIIDGYVGKTFKPENNVTRAELAKTVCKAFLEEDYKVSESDYDDITEDLWYYEYVKICDYYGIFKDICKESFCGNEFVNRQEMCTVVYRAFQHSGGSLRSYERKEFLDKTLFVPYATRAIERLQAAGIVNGFSDYCFHPYYETTRAEICKVIELLLEHERKK